MAAGANSPGTLKTYIISISQMWNFDLAAGDYSPGTRNLIPLPGLTFIFFLEKRTFSEVGEVSLFIVEKYL